VKLLSSISGIGKKTAERMVLELKDKLAPAPGEASALGQASMPHDKTLADTVAALEALGTKPAEAQKSAEAARAMLGTQVTVENLVRAALKGGK